MRILIVAWLFALTVDVKSQDAVIDQAALDSIISYTKEVSVLKDSVDWKEIEAKMNSIHKKNGIAEATQYMLKELKDFHGRIWLDKIPYFGLNKEWKPSIISLDSADMYHYRYCDMPFHAELLSEDVGYLSVPGIVMSDQDANNAASISNLIDSLSGGSNLSAWIIDLRLNGGGTMYPMLSGLAPFFEPGPFGYFIDEASGYKEAWSLREGELHFEDYQVTDYGVKSKWDYAYTPVVVLVSGLTCSSGEVVALSFRNRPNTLLLGESTSGYTTTVGWQPINERIILQITTSYYADRLQNVYKGTPIEPDEVCLDAYDFENLSNDKQVMRALEWLSNKR